MQTVVECPECKKEVTLQVESCNNCELVERENVKLRNMIIAKSNQLNIMDSTNQKVTELIAKAAGVKIVFNKSPLPGERPYRIERGPDKVKELENKISKIMDLVDDNTAVKIQGILDN